MELALKGISNEQDALTGQVKWYDPEKGFGFVLVDGFEDEFLLNRNVLQNCRRDSITENSRIEFQPAFTSKGCRVAELLLVTPPNMADNKDGSSLRGINLGERVPARVKWFDVSKGYGFVNNYGSEEDIFVGSEALTRSGLSSLRSGEAVCIRVEEHEGRSRVCQIYDWAVE